MAESKPLQFVFWRPKSWRDTVVLGDLLEGWLHRGHASREWNLVSGIERTAEMFSHPLSTLHEAERDILNQFKRRGHHFVPSLPADAGDLEWMSLLQHHGGPTRFLDFTESFYVAAFFAVEDAEKDAAIWSVNRHMLDKQLLQIAESYDDIPDFQSQIQRVARGVVEDAIGTSTGPPILDEDETMHLYFRRPNIVAVRPWRLNERMTIQQGWLLCPTHLAASFEHNLARAMGLRKASLPKRVRVGDLKEMKELLTSKAGLAGIKIILPRRMHLDIVRDLRKMNITAATLFPGLDGFARSLKFPLRIFDNLATIHK